MVASQLLWLGPLWLGTGPLSCIETWWTLMVASQLEGHCG